GSCVLTLRLERCSGVGGPFAARRRASMKGSPEQLGHRLAVLEDVLGTAVVVAEGSGGVDAKDVVQRCQHVLHPDRLADDALAAGVGSADDLAGLQPAASDPEKTCLWPVTPPVRRHVAHARRAAELPAPPPGPAPGQAAP